MKRNISLYSIYLLTAGSSAISLSAKEKTNVVFILADDLGYGDLSCYGQEKFQTPNIDELAQRGIRFTECYSGSTVSAPSRCSLVTYRHQHHLQNIQRGRLQNRSFREMGTGRSWQHR